MGNDSFETTTSYQLKPDQVGKSSGMPEHIVMALSLAAKRGYGAPLGAGAIGQMAENALLTQTAKRAARSTADPTLTGGPTG